MSTSTIAIIITVLTVISFVTEKIPLACTAVISSVLMGIFGCMKMGSVYSGYASTATVMVGGMMIVGDALFQNGVAQKIGSVLVNSPIAKSERILVFFTVILTSLISAFLSNSGTIAMFMPLLGAAVLASGGKLRYKMLVMPAGFGCAVGGCGTLVGSTAQLIAQGILVKAGGKPMGFFDLSYAVAPMCLVMAIWFSTIGYNIMEKVLADNMASEQMDAIAAAAKEHPTQGDEPLTWRGWLSAATLIGCIIAFMMNGNVAVIGLAGAAILVTSGCMPLKQTLRNLDWNTLIILSAAQGFAAGLNESGGGKVIANAVLNAFGGQNASIVVMLAIGITLSVCLSNFMSNGAVAAMLVPIFIQIAMALGANPTTFTIAISIGASTVISTPTGTPCVTQTLPAGYRYMDYVKSGLPCNVILTVMAIVLCATIYPLH